jgi:hypothetical protein
MPNLAHPSLKMIGQTAPIYVAVFARALFNGEYFKGVQLALHRCFIGFTNLAPIGVYLSKRGTFHNWREIQRCIQHSSPFKTSKEELSI